MHLKKHLDKLIDYYDSDQAFRALSTQAFSEILSRGKKAYQPGAIKVGQINEDKRKYLLDLIKPNWWDINEGRQKNYPSQKNTKNILLINFENHKSREDEVVQDQKSQLSIFARKQYINIKPFLDFVESFASSIGNGVVRNTTLVNLLPGKEVYDHYDSGCYYMIRDRYHLVLYSPLGSKQIFENEEFRFKQGEIWWYNNKLHHNAFNESDDSRIHLIFDVLPHKNRMYENYLINKFYSNDSIKVYGESDIINK